MNIDERLRWLRKKKFFCYCACVCPEKQKTYNTLDFDYIWNKIITCGLTLNILLPHSHRYVIFFNSSSLRYIARTNRGLRSTVSHFIVKKVNFDVLSEKIVIAQKLLIWIFLKPLYPMVFCLKIHILNVPSNVSLCSKCISRR